MQGVSIEWLIGSLMTLGALILTMLGLRQKDRASLFETIESGDRVLRDHIDDIRAGYVRRDDLEAHIRRIEKSVDEMRIEMREQRRTNERLDATLASSMEMLKNITELLTRMRVDLHGAQG